MAYDYIALGVFAVAYLLFILLPHHRWLVGLVGVAILLLSRTVSSAAALEMVNWNVMGVFVGTVVLADLFVLSNMPAFLAERMIRHIPRTALAMLAVCTLTGLLSCAVENVATVLIIAPVALAMTRKLDISPVPLMIGVTVSSNLQGAATLIGDPPSMLLAAYNRMGFTDFFWYHGRPSLFFAVQIGALASLVVLYCFYRRYRQVMVLELRDRYNSMVPSLLMMGLIAGLSVSSFFDPDFVWLAGALSVIFGMAGLTWYAGAGGKLRPMVTKLDWQTVVFLGCVFVLVGSLAERHWLEKVASGLGAVTANGPLAAFVMMVGFSVVVSAFVDNVPYLAAMLPVAHSLAADLGQSPTLLMFGLLIGASIGGNITPIGASANIVAVGYLKQRGYHVTFWDFVRIGLPFSVVAVVAASAFVWLVWA